MLHLFCISLHAQYMFKVIAKTPKYLLSVLNRLNANPRKWSNTLKQFIGNLPTNCLSVFDHFMGLAFKGLKGYISVEFL